MMELKLMMEKLGAPQTHLGLKSMIREVDEDFDGKLSLREVPAYLSPRRGSDSEGTSDIQSRRQVALASPEHCLNIYPTILEISLRSW